MINPPDKSESQNQANENPVDSKFTRDALGAFIKKPMPTNVFVLQHSLGSSFPLPQTDLANSERSGNTKSGEPVEDCSMYLAFRDRPMEVTR